MKELLLNRHCSMIAGNVLSIAVFNYCRITITKEMSATTQQVWDNARIVIVWSVSLFAGWQPWEYQ